MAGIVYARVGQILQDEFTYLGSDPSRTPVTGKVDANFTKRLSLNTTGGQSTAGVTITEIGNGKYNVTATAAAFPAVTGEYVLSIFDTTSPQYYWEQIYSITSDGTPSGTTGVASFTAVVGNGRVWDGSTALVGATVYIRDPSGVLYTSVLTVAGGLWGPVFFTTAGVYSITVQKSGYNNATGTITVAGTVATGPGTDLTMSVTSTSGVTLSDLTAYARRMAGDRVGTKADTELLQSCNDAVDHWAKKKRWQRYISRGQLTLQGAYTTGTIALVNGAATCILTGGTWPTWAASGVIYVQNQSVRVLSRDSNTQLTLEANWQAASVSGLATILYQDTYPLPDNLYMFGRLLPGPRWQWGGEAVGADQLFQQQSLFIFGQLIGYLWAFVNSSIVLFPYPSNNILCAYWYYRRPTPMVGPTDTADIDPAHIEGVRRSIDYQVALRYNGYAGGTVDQAAARAEEAFALASENDRTTNTRSEILGSTGRRAGFSYNPALPGIA